MAKQQQKMKSDTSYYEGKKNITKEINANPKMKSFADSALKVERKRQDSISNEFAKGRAKIKNSAPIAKIAKRKS